MSALINPSVSVVMSVHNGQDYLDAAVQSVLSQTYRDFEFLIIDDGSSDRSPAILREFSSRDNRVRVISQANTGLTRALNRGIESARGRFVARMDADDLCEPSRFAEQTQFLDDNPSCVAVGCQLSLIDPDGDFLAYRNAPQTHDDIVSRLLNGIGAIPHPSAMIRRETLCAVGGYREEFQFAQDLDLWLRLSEQGSLANLDKPLLRYRLHCSSLTTQKRAVQLECARRAVAEAFVRRGIKDFVPPSMAHSTPSASQVLRSWTRMALRTGNRTAAWKHCRHAVAAAPCSISNLGMLGDWLRYGFLTNRS
ncbi:glycosyltransferase [Stieleria sp. TO1_6]|uniref:glycosyltransferase family 2 protein n=1 Tax=Stieleria tagensis TaxID=2956795 RepID=UPI00209BA8B7|nr:glycosyltransferase [Stieleria tagensis]MCO8120565.1 glycosyltransferase [Stieleria tagensis]